AAIPSREAEMELTIAGRRDVWKDFHFCRPFASRIGQHVEVSEHSLAIRSHRHGAAALAASTRVLRAILSLCEVQAQFVRSRLEWNVVGEVPLAAAAIDDRILRPPD